MCKQHNLASAVVYSSWCVCSESTFCSRINFYYITRTIIQLAREGRKVKKEIFSNKKKINIYIKKRRKINKIIKKIMNSRCSVGF